MIEKKILKKKEVLEGAEELIAEWGYALDKLAFGSREGSNIFREIEDNAANHWFKKIVGKLPKTKTAYEATVKFRDLADERGVILKENFKLEEKKEIILGTFLSQDCPYKGACIERKKENKQFICFRATPFVVAVRLMANKEYKADVIEEQTNPGKVCIIKGMPTETAFKVGLSYKLSKGTVKLHELDCEKIGIGLIDNVTIRPSRKEIAEKKLTAMSYSQTKYPAGMILMNIGDAKILGLEERDTVYIKKAGEKEEATFVDTEHYEGKPGEFEVPGLEVPEEEEKKEEPELKTPKKALKLKKGKKKNIKKEEEEKPEEEEKEEDEEPEEVIEEKTGEKEEEEPGMEEEKKKVIKKGQKKKRKKEKPEIKTKGIKDSHGFGNKVSKQSEEDKTKQMKDFEANIEALRNK